MHECTNNSLSKKKRKKVKACDDRVLHKNILWISPLNIYVTVIN
uniref:Uncharacterized protein n=1 Tax=Glossina morsitans morsitans TaxID=37546 RepID=A0ABK9NG80_GLOMM